MAKKGGTSEINGFMNIKTEDASRTKQKVSSRNTEATTNTKINTSKNAMKDEIDDKNLKVKRLTNKDSPEAKKVPDNNASKISKSTISSSSKTKVQPSKDISKTQKEPSKTHKYPSATLKEPPKTLRPSNDSTKDRLHKDKGIDKSKTTDSTPKPRMSTGQNISSRRVEIKNGSKPKQTPSNMSQKGTTLVANKNTEKIQKVSSKDSNIIRIRTDKDNKERKIKLDDSKGETSKTLNQKKKTTDHNRIIEKDVRTDKNTTSRSNVLSKNSNGSVLKQKTSKTTKPTSSEKEKKRVNEKKSANQEASRKIDSFSETVISEMKVELPEEDLTVKSSYKDLIYFEVDMGNTEQPSKSRMRSARMKSATSEPPPISRQGTFTKDEILTSFEPEAQVTKEGMSEEKPTTIKDGTEEVEYEDDFEDYESDFEEYISESDSESGLSSKSETESEPVEIRSSKNQQASITLRLNVKTVEEERKLDSGNYDLSSKPAFPPSVKQKQLDLIKEAITRENTLFDKRKITPEEPAPEENKAVSLDFLSAFQKKEDTNKAECGKQRSSIILQMINLHEQKIDLFEEIFSDDDIFQNMYQNRNVNHMFTETELALKEEEVQTNEIKVQNKWTQYPISYHPWSDKSFNLKTFLEDQRGYGGDNITTDYNIWWNVKYDTKKLYNFIDAASKVMLIMLEEEARWRYDEKSVSVGNLKEDLGFSEGCIPIQVANVSFLKTRPICDILFSPHDSNVFISSHRFIQDIEKLSSYTEQFFGRSILCVWSILEPSQPLYILVASCQISAVSFDSEYDNFIYAGLTDGSVCLWDLNESSMYHKETTAGSMDYLLRTPTFCTSHLTGKDNHHNVIVSVKSLGYENLGRLSSQNYNPTQILTLEADGKVVLWIVTRTLSYLEKTEKNVDQFDPGISYWGKFKLVMGKTLNPENSLPSSENKWGLQFICMSLAPEYKTKNKTSIKSVLVGTNVGNIVHFYASEDDIDIPVFSNESGEKYAFSVMCLERNPHGYPVFLAGCNDGKIRFYVLDKPKPFKIVSSDGDFVYTPVIQIRWSPLGQGLFFALDINFCLHLWDICKRDCSPQKTISLKKLQAAHFDLTYDKKFVYIGLSVKRVKIDIHRLKEKFITVKSDEEREFFTEFLKCNSKLLDKD